MTGISSWSIKNPIPTIVMFICLVYAGYEGYQALRINNMPDMEFPMISVSVSQQGAAPSELETQVTNLVENAVSTLSDVESVSSTISEGSSQTNIEFVLDTDMTQALSDVESAIASIKGNLPTTADDPQVTRVNASDTSILSYVVEAADMNPDQLSWYVDNTLAKKLLAVDGVSKISRLGGVNRAVMLDIEPDTLAAYGLTVSAINTALAQQNVDVPGGRTTDGVIERSIRTLGSVKTIEGLKALQIPLAKGGSVRLDDIAVVRDTWETPRQNARFNGQEVVAFEVYSGKNASQVHVAGRVEEAVKALNASPSNKVQVREVTSSADFVVDSFDAAFEALWVGALLSVVVVFLFLRDWRATLVAATALPLSLIPTFFVMDWLDMSLNSITLLALSLVVGILVDDAIVEIENIVRHMRQAGIPAYRAAMEAADEIGLAVIATTGTIVAVFLPVAFMPGIAGKFFYSFAVVTCVSVALSLLVARTLTPMLSAFFIRSVGHEEKTPGWVTAYVHILKIALRFRYLTFILGLLFFAGSVYLATQLKQEFMTATDRGRTQIAITLQPGSTLGETDAAIQRVYHLIKDQPEIKSVFSSIGGGISAGGGPAGRGNKTDVTSGSLVVNLKDRSERSVSQQAFEERIAPLIDDIPGIQVRIGDSSNSGATYSLTLVSADSDALAEASNQIAEEMRQISGLNNPSTTAAAVKPELIIVPDKNVVAAAKTTITEIAQIINVSTLGPSDNAVAKFNLGDRQVPIVPMLSVRALANPSVIETLPISFNDKTVPVGTLADIRYGAGPTSIRHSEGKRSVTIEADMQGITLGDAQKAVRSLAAYKAMPETVGEQEQGDGKRLKELFGGFTQAFTTGVLLMYITLVLLFRSFLQPITILMALPLSIGGAMGFLYVTGSSLAITALIGILLLMGIAAKNSILLVEYAIVAKRNGRERGEALLSAARKRARPIVMTSIAMGAGMLPIALGVGADAESRAPMGVAVIGGLISSTVLSLVYVPVVYTLVDDIENFMRRIFSGMVNRAD
jgi:HAE1 family hydrophobic/amphiphilic exporter-1